MIGSWPTSLACQEYIERYGTNLVQQVRRAFGNALNSGARVIVYTEPDKEIFFSRGLNDLVVAADARHSVVLPSRNEASMSTFPEGQQRVETLFNSLIAGFLGTSGDVLYGPIAFPENVVRRYITAVSDELGWGWRPFVLARCMRDGVRIRTLEGEFNCPEGQRSEDELSHRLYRLRQLYDNIRGLHAGLAG